MRYSCVKVTAELLQFFDNTIISPKVPLIVPT